MAKRLNYPLILIITIEDANVYFSEKKEIMKKIITLFTALLIVGAMNAQSLISTEFSDYETNESFTRVSISKKMFEIIANLDPDEAEEKDLIESLGGVDGLKIIVADSSENPKSLFDETMKRLPSRFEELMTVNDEAELIVFLIDEKDGRVKELIMVMKGDDEFVLLDLFGDINLKDIAKISRQMNIDHMDKLENLENDDED